VGSYTLMISQVVKQDVDNDRRDAEEMEVIGRKLLGINENLECVAQACPDLLRRGIDTFIYA